MKFECVAAVPYSKYSTQSSSINFYMLIPELAKCEHSLRQFLYLFAAMSLILRSNWLAAFLHPSNFNCACPSLQDWKNAVFWGYLML